MTVNFIAFTKEHLPIFFEWAKIPHVRDSWFQEGYEPVEAIYDKLEPHHYDHPFIITLNEKPIGFIQYADLDLYSKQKGSYPAVYAKAPKNSGCLDLFIAEEKHLNQGYGYQVIQKLSEWILTNTEIKHLFIDPSIDNLRAIHSYRKAGFFPQYTVFDGTALCLILKYQSPLEIFIEKGFYLKHLSLQDSKALYSVIDRNRDYLREFLEWVDLTKKVEDTEAFINMVLKASCELKQFSFGMILDNTLIGGVGINCIQGKRRIGYWISEDKQAQGYVTKAVLALTKALSENFSWKEYEILSAPENDRSKKVAERLGFNERGICEKGAFSKGEKIDALSYTKILS